MFVHSTQKPVFRAAWLLALLLQTLLVDGAARQKPGVVSMANDNDIAVTQDKSLDSFGENTKPTLESLKRSVFRITVYRKVFRWSRPFDDNYVVGSLGSGFLVGDAPLTIATCAHVVNGADRVYIQVTDFGKTKFEAQVATINNYADVAILTLKKPEELIAKLAEAKMKLVPLHIADETPTLGHNVVAPGFPLGQDTMTLSTGVVSGVDHVSFHYTNLAIQSTAIISSGNSGSPLLDANTLEVIGVNYAKNPREAQINYVVGLWRLKQVLMKHQQVHKKGEKSGEPYQFRLVEPGLVLTPGVDALYMLSQGSSTCNNGPLISSISPSSPFHDADPPVPANSFLVSVDGITLDKFGQGIKKKYVDEMVDFSDLMWMRGGTGEEDISFETCNANTGDTQKHKMSMAWNKEREGQGVQYIYDPRLDHIPFEIYGDLLFMPLTENHINTFSGDYNVDSMVRFLQPEARRKPKLAVMLLKGGTEAGDALKLSKGSDLEVVDTINGHAVNTLEDYRQHFFPDPPTKQSAEEVQNVKLMLSKSSGDNSSHQSLLLREHQAVRKGEELIWSLKTDAGKEFASFFVDTLKKQESSARYASHVMTPTAKAAMEQLGFFAKKKSLLASPRDSAASTLIEDDDSMPVFGEPLQVVRRAGDIGILDFAPHEGFDRW